MATLLPKGDTLERLQQDEAALEREIAEVRRAAAAAVEGARREAEAIVATARRDSEREAARLRFDATQEAERILGEERTGLEDELRRLVENAAANRARAVARAVALVTGEGA